MCSPQDQKQQVDNKKINIQYNKFKRYFWI